jgi:protein TonB
MFDNLIESNPSRRISHPAASTMSSLALHGALVFGAVQATMSNETPMVSNDSDTTKLVFLTESKPKPPEPETAQPVLDLVAPVPFGFKLIDPPSIVPAGIPPVDLTVDFDPRDYKGVGVPGGAFDGLRDTVEMDFSRTFTTLGVDERPRRISGPLPRYPELLRQAGVEGTVVLEFVVDTLGRVEEATITVVRATNQAFVAPAVVVITESLFRPGRVRGRAVRVLVRQSVGFTIL